MASLRFISLLIVTLSLFLTSSSRSVSTTHKTAVLDVVSPLQQPQEILSTDPNTPPSLTSKPDFVSGSDSILFNSSSPLSLKLYSRDILFPQQHQNYKSLLLSQLERDSARLAEINSRIRIAVEGINRSTLKPISQDDPRFQTQDLTRVTVKSEIASGHYVSYFKIGTPPQTMYIALDTGSDVNWIQCQPRIHFYNQSDPIFDPTLSSTYSTIPSSDPRCQALNQDLAEPKSNKCQYQVRYADNSNTTGDFVTETVSFGDSGKLNGIALGCGHDNRGEFSESAGLIGLGRGAVSLTSQLKAFSFSYCLVDRDLKAAASPLDFNTTLSDTVPFAPLLKNHEIETFYYIGFKGITIDGEPLPIRPSVFEFNPSSGAGGVIMDIGATLTYLTSQAYDSFRDSFIKHAGKLKIKKATSSPSIHLLDTCFYIKSLTTVKVPKVTFVFTSGKSLDLPPKNCLLPDDRPGIYCLAFSREENALSPSVIGNVQQQGIRFTFDLKKERMGFLPYNNCS